MPSVYKSPAPCRYMNEKKYFFPWKSIKSNGEYKQYCSSILQYVAVFNTASKDTIGYRSITQLYALCLKFSL